MSLNHCNWNRYWSSPETRIHIGDDGFVSDPTSWFGRIANESLMPYGRFGDIPCLVLLGEPGIGKSSAIREIATLAATNGNARRIDLFRDCGTDTLLFRNLFDTQWFKSWEAGGDTLELFLDSFDECAKQFPIIASVLQGELSSRPLERLKLRIACRTAEWPAALGEELEKIWGASRFSVYTLAPLLRADVILAAETNGISSSDTFVQQVRDRAVQAFASRPITLELLINIFKREGQLPSGLVDLYERGLPLLCEEPAGRAKNATPLSGRQRLAVASRIAGALVFANKLAVRTGPDRGDIERWELPVAELAGYSESVDGITVAVDDHAISETVSSGLFASVGAERRAFAHQTYIEFLAARYLYRGGFTKEQIYSVITVSGEAELTIAPQLEEITAWLASMDAGIFRDVLDRQAEVLVRGDVATMDVDARSALVDGFLTRIAHEAVPDWYRLSAYYKRLNHPDLTGQLTTWIVDPSINQEARSAAIEITRECSCIALSGALAALAINHEDTHRVRVRAAAAVARIGTPEARQQLLPLAKGNSGKDHDDELRGYALRALWPNHISALDLFGCLGRAQDDHFLGSYRMFLRHDDFQVFLRAEDLPIALRWIIRQQVSHDPTDDLRHCAYNIILRAWDFADRADVRLALADVFWFQLRRHHHELAFADRDEEARFLEKIRSDARRRRAVIAAMVEASTPDDYVTGLRWTEPPLVQEEDFAWLLDNVLATQQPIVERWLSLAATTFRIAVASHVESVRAAMAVSLSVHEAFFPSLCVELGSPAARQMQEWHGRELSRRRSGAEVLDPPPWVRVLSALDGCLNRDPAEWHHLVRQLTLKPTSTHYDLCVSVLTTPGWEEADARVRADILEAARRHVTETIPDEAWIGTNSFSDVDLASFAAFRLLLDEYPAALTTLSPSHWRRWAPSLLAYSLVGNEDDGAGAQRELVALAYRDAFDEILGTVDRLITVDDTFHRSILFLDRLDRCWDDRVSQALAARAKKLDVGPVSFGALIDALLVRRDQAATNHAISLISIPPPTQDPAREFSIHSAARLLVRDPSLTWQVFWNAAQSDTQWAESVFERVAADFDGGFTSQLDEAQVGCLLDWLLQVYPYGSDPKRTSSSMGPDDMVRQWRDALISRLREWGTVAAVAEIARLRQVHPELPWLQRVEQHAQRARHGRAWSPIPPRQLIELAQDGNKRFVTSGEQLLEVLCESLQRLQVKLQGETPRARLLWDTVVRQPKKEEDLSDYIKSHLEDDLVQRGIIAGREVKIRRRNSPEGEPWQQVDIHVDAIGNDRDDGSGSTIRAVIEVKGCWNSGLKTAMNEQLLGRYLAESESPHGLYVVGWFLCPYWDEADRGVGETRRNFGSFQECRDFLEAQASDLSQQLATAAGGIRALVLDITLR